MMSVLQSEVSLDVVLNTDEHMYVDLPSVLSSSYRMSAKVFMLPTEQSIECQLNTKKALRRNYCFHTMHV